MARFPELQLVLKIRVTRAISHPIGGALRERVLTIVLITRLRMLRDRGFGVENFGRRLQVSHEHILADVDEDVACLETS